MDRKLALFIDFENIARGVRQRHADERVDLRAIIAELEQKGRLLLKRAYADWSYYKEYRGDLLQQGIDPVQVFAATRERDSWKNGADIRIAIDAMETAYRFQDVTDFVLVSGDSDFLSLVSRLRENGKIVVGVGLKSSSSQFLVKACDEYLFYEDLPDYLGSVDDELGEKRDGRTILLHTVRKMVDRQGLPGMPPPGTPLRAMAVKAAMRRIDPTWDEQFEGFATFIDFVAAQSDVILLGRPGEASEYYLAERGSVAETNLRRMLEFAGALPSGEELEEGEEGAEEGDGEAPSMLPRDEVATAISRILTVLGSDGLEGVTVQRSPVKASLLRTRLRYQLPGFEERNYGYTNFLDLLLSMRDRFRLARAEQRGDLLVAEIGTPAEVEIQGLPEPIPGGGWVQSPEQKYLGILRQRRIRHVAMEERYAIIIALWRIFEEAAAAGEEISLKEAKDRLHQWFEQNQPNVPWDSINNVVYHLFWTWCFYFSEGPEDLPLWDRVTQWNVGINSAEDVIRQCDLGMVKMIVDGIGTVEPEVVCNVLGDGNPERLSYFTEICEQALDRAVLAR